MGNAQYPGYQTYISGIITQGGGEGSSNYVTTYRVSISITSSMSEFETSQVSVMSQEGSQVITIYFNIPYKSAILKFYVDGLPKIFKQEILKQNCLICQNYQFYG